MTEGGGNIEVKLWVSERKVVVTLVPGCGYVDDAG